MAFLRSGKQGRGKGSVPVPDEHISLNEIRRISVPIYGMTMWRNLFTARQTATLSYLCRLVASHRGTAGASLAISVDKVADLGNALGPWEPNAECPRHLLARQAIGMAWDFAESVPPGDASGSFVGSVERSADAQDSVNDIGLASAQVQQTDATRHLLPDGSTDIWFTDPPYYDAVPYAHLADFFFVWIKRARQALLGAPSDAPLTPKDAEVVVDRPHRLKHVKQDASYI